MRHILFVLVLLALASCKQTEPEPEPEPQGPDYAALSGIYAAEQTSIEIRVTYETDPANPELPQYDTLIQVHSPVVEVVMIDEANGSGELSWDISTLSEYYTNPQRFFLFEALTETEHDFAYSDSWSYDYSHEFGIRFPESTDSLYATHSYRSVFGTEYAGQGDSLARLLVRDYTLKGRKQ